MSHSLNISEYYFKGKTDKPYLTLDDDGHEIAKPHPKLLLHTCCAPCSPYVLRHLKKVFELNCFFYNPNIHPEEEYEFRYQELEKLLEGLELPLEKGEYEIAEWMRLNKDLGHLPERDTRCVNCIKLRLERTAQKAVAEDYEYFSTVLSVSPHKVADMINLLGKELSEKYGVKYLYSDLKKNNGYLQTTRLARQYDLKRQDYCGCIFSKQ